MSIAPAKPFQIEAELAALDPVERDAAGAFLAASPPGLGAPLAIVIPAYNEEPTVAGVIEEIPREAYRACLTAGLEAPARWLPAPAPAALVAEFRALAGQAPA